MMGTDYIYVKLIVFAVHYGLILFNIYWVAYIFGLKTDTLSKLNSIVEHVITRMT